MFVVQSCSSLDIIRHVDIMLPSDVESDKLMEFPFEADAQRHISGSVDLLVFGKPICADTETDEDIRGVATDTFVVFVGTTEAEEIELRHDVGIDHSVLPFGVELLAADSIVVGGDPLSGHFRLDSPALGELIAEMDAVSLTRTQENMICGIADIVSATRLNTELAEERLLRPHALRIGTYTRTREHNKKAYI